MLCSTTWKGKEMIIRCWGARGSIPVSGKEYLKYGGDTTCIEIRTSDGDIIIIDAGSGIRRLGNALLKEGKYEYSIFFTHGHWDHLLGFPFFKPIYRHDVKIGMYGCYSAQMTLKEIVSRVMAPPHFPVDYEDIHCTLTYHESCHGNYEIKSLKIASIPISHPNQGLGYRFEENGKVFVFLTDNELSYTHPGGLSFSHYVEFCKGADFLIHDSEFTDGDYKRTWGHSTFKEALDLSMEAGVKTLGLFHHNQERTDEEIDAIVAESEQLIKSRGVALRCIAIQQGFEIEL